MLKDEGGCVMAFDWLRQFQQGTEKRDDYAEKTLAAYRLGMRAKGSIVGVRIVVDPNGCEACKALDETAVYHPDEAPMIPLPGCSKGRHCGCVYRPVMSYMVEDSDETG